MNQKITLLFSLCLLPFLSGLSWAQPLVLQPGDSKVVTLDHVRYLEKGNTPNALPPVAAQATFTYSADGATLTVKFQNAATLKSAALYAFEIGLTPQQATQMRAVTTAVSEFPPNVRWMGPTDDVELTAGQGVFTFAAREAVLVGIKNYMQREPRLPLSFLTPGQPGSLTLRLTHVGKAKLGVLRLDPMAYFLVPDPGAPTTRRLRLVARRSPGNGQP